MVLKGIKTRGAEVVHAQVPSPERGGVGTGKCKLGKDIPDTLRARTEGVSW